MRREFARLEAEIGLCDRCYGFEPRWVTRFERPEDEARILLVSERPPRALLESQERVGLSATDGTTRTLRAMIEQAGIPAAHVVLAAAMLCRPRSTRLEAAVPATTCVRECAHHVRDLVLALRPRLIVPLGRVALRSLRFAFAEHEAIARLRFPSSVGRTVQAGDTFIHPLYLTTGRARAHRPIDQQERDWRAVGRLWQWIEQGERGPAPGPV